MVHKFQRGMGETARSAVQRARESHGAIEGGDALAYLAMTRRHPYGEGFLPYPGLILKLVEVLGEENPLVADLGCGPGNLARLLLDAHPQLHVACVDSSANMLDVARGEIAHHAEDSRIQFHNEDLRGPLTLQEVSVAVFKGTAHHIPDLAVTINSIQRTLAQRSVFLLHDFRRDGDLRTLLPFVEDLFALLEDDFAICSRVLGYVDSRRVSYSGQELVTAMRESGVSLVTTLVSPDEIVIAGTSALDRLEQEAVANAVAAAFADLGFKPMEENHHDKENIDAVCNSRGGNRCRDSALASAKRT